MLQNTRDLTLLKIHVVADYQDNEFAKYNGETFHFPYDYNSIMHFAFNAFSVDGTSPTILPNIPAAIGNRKVMSPFDVKRINKLYDCPDPEVTTTEPGDQRDTTPLITTPTTTVTMPTSSALVTNVPIINDTITTTPDMGHNMVSPGKLGIISHM